MKSFKFSKKDALPGIIVVVIFICFGLVVVTPKAFMDFPCFMTYDEVNACVRTSDLFTELPENQHERLHVFLTIRKLGMVGGGCHSRSSSTGSLEFETPITMLNFKQDGESLIANGKELQPGDHFSYTKFWNLNPITVYSLEFTYHGRLPFCDSNAPAQVFVIGTYGDEISAPKIISVLIVSLLIVYSVRKFFKRDMIKRGKAND